MLQLPAFLSSTLAWQVLCGLLAAALLVNLILCHKGSVHSWRQRRVKRAMQHSGIADYQEKVEALAKDNAELAREPYDTTGINVEIGLRNGERGAGTESISIDDIQLSPKPSNIVALRKGQSYLVDETTEYGLEEYMMGKPTEDELDTAIRCAAQMRENGADERHLGKCLLNLNYRNKLLEKVLEHAELYVHNGSDPHEHTLLLKAIRDAQEAGQSIQHNKDGREGTFMIS